MPAARAMSGPDCGKLVENRVTKSIFSRIFIASLCARCSTFLKQYSWCDPVGEHRHSELTSWSALPNGSRRSVPEEALQDSRQLIASPATTVLSGSNFACHHTLSFRQLEAFA